MSKKQNKIRFLKKLSRVRIGIVKPTKPHSPKKGRKTYERSEENKIDLKEIE